MEGASGIFDKDLEEIMNGSDKWREKGRDKMTSDILAICEAANEFGIDEILYYDSHYAGNSEFNVHLNQLPANVKTFDTPDRCFFWRRIRGQAAIEPFGIITVGQHARNGEENAYFPHTIQSPPIKSLWINDLHIAEIGMSVLNFQGTKFIANIGCAASEIEAKELSNTVHHISVKNKLKGWEPTSEETYNLIKGGVSKALNDYSNIETVKVDPPYKFRMELCKYFYFDIPNEYPWKGTFEKREASWEAPSFEIGFEIFHYVREYIKINETDRQTLRKEVVVGKYNTLD